MFRGREMVHTYRGREQLDAVLAQLGPIAKMESSPRMEGRFMSMILVADREAVAEAKRAEVDAEPGEAAVDGEAATDVTDAPAADTAEAATDEEEKQDAPAEA